MRGPGMLSRVPRKFKDAGAPKLLSFSLRYPPFVAVCIGDNYMLVFGTSGQHVNEDVGLTFPDDYVALPPSNKPLCRAAAWRSLWPLHLGVHDGCCRARLQGSSGWKMTSSWSLWRMVT